jgi:hypothetical protein
MSGDATLTEPTARAAIEDLKLTMTSFAEGDAATVTACVIEIERLAPADSAAVAKAIGALPDVAEVTVDATGLAVCMMAGDRAPSQESVAGALAPWQLGVASVKAEEWPRACALYDVELTGVAADGVPAVRRDLAGLDQVLAAQVFADGSRALLRLKEPCSKIEERVRAAIGARGGEVAKFTLREAPVR